MDDFEMKDKKDVVYSRDEILSIPVRAGKRTYFFDIKATRSNDLYLTITESKKRFNNEQAKFVFEKHKLFLYKEDFDKFTKALNDAVKFIETGERPILTEVEDEEKSFYNNEFKAEENTEDDLSYEKLEFEDLDIDNKL